jgi:hypothetical protein
MRSAELPGQRRQRTSGKPNLQFSIFNPQFSIELPPCRFMGTEQFKKEQAASK